MRPQIRIFKVQDGYSFSLYVVGTSGWEKTVYTSDRVYFSYSQALYAAELESKARVFTQ